MADSSRQLDSEPAPQRKRIAVACGRCRKRKIRCSGDLGQGRPCSNCKTAGNEPCLFLRVSSHETSIRAESGENFAYNVSDARMAGAYRSNPSLATPLHYGTEVAPPPSPMDPGNGGLVYRSSTASYGAGQYGSATGPGGSSVAQAVAGQAKQPGSGYYPTMTGYAPGPGGYSTVSDEYGYGMGPVVSHDGGGMWASRVGSMASSKAPGPPPAPSYGNMYIDAADSPYCPSPSAYGSVGPGATTNLVHRPAHHHGLNMHPSQHHGPHSSGLSSAPPSLSSLGGPISASPISTVSTESPNFSFSSVAASLPAPSSSTTADSRLLPNPTTGRPPPPPSSLAPYTLSKTPLTSSTATAAASAPGSSSDSLSDAASSTSPAGSYDQSALSRYGTSSRLGGGGGSDGYSSASTPPLGGTTAAATAGESIFSDQDRTLQSQGSAFDLHSYTTGGDSRRDSAITTGSSSSSGGTPALTYVPQHAVAYVDHATGQSITSPTVLPGGTYQSHHGRQGHRAHHGMGHLHQRP